MSIEIYKTRVQIIVSNKAFNKDIDCLNCFGLIIDYSKDRDYYTVEFEYVDQNGEIDTEIAFLKRNEFIIIDDK